ncbi:MAG: beta-propeller domain-containing protein, partial [Phycisphaerae bacterium]|nr:beta-propeller domain-containing protein [Phycisphaerae bacterium]
DPDDPRLMGELDLRGRGIEMYVVGAQAYILLSADYDYAYYGGVGLAEVDGGSAGRPIPPQPDFEGSQLAIVDVSDPSAPVSEGKLNLVGFANESRRVGDVIYVVGSNYTPYYGYREDEERHEGFVASVNVADPRNIVAVERKTVAGNALNMHVSETALFAASQEYNYEDGNTYTNVQVVDISDPAGTIAMRGSVDVPGTIRNRFYMDDYEGVFRIATESQGFGFRRVRLFTYDLADLDNVIALGQTDIIEGETLEAVRFDGPRGYVVTFLQVDPLFVLDLRDPTAPAVAGHLEVPGFSTHIEPRGDRLIAIGIDDTDGRRPAVSYYDVEDPANPAELGRVVLGPPGSFTESEATYDEKAFKIVDELGLIAIPFRYVNYAWSPLPDEPVLLPGGADGAAADQASPDTHDQPACLNGVQLVDFDDGGLAQRGWFEHRGSVERVGVICDRVFALSQVCLQTVNISDRDNPVKAGQADFFNEDEMPYYADDCGDYYGPWDFPQQDPFDTLSILIQVFLNGDLCGMLSMLPLLALPVSLFLMKASLPGRRRSGGRPVNLP